MDKMDGPLSANRLTLSPHEGARHLCRLILVKRASCLSKLEKNLARDEKRAISST